jgi:hypothetical protein
MSAANIQNKMISAMNSSGSVHVTMRNHNGSPSEIYSDDSLANSGRQVITLSNGARAEVLLINTGARRVTSRWSTRRVRRSCSASYQAPSYSDRDLAARYAARRQPSSRELR